ncbi:hypothetical protein V6N13_106210 [Hibiscus sabdariffa]
MFPKVKSAGCSPADASVYLNVYDLTNANGYVYWAGLGIFHSGVEGINFKNNLLDAFVRVLTIRYNKHSLWCGVCLRSSLLPNKRCFEPPQCPGFKFRKLIFIGTTCLDPARLREFMERQSASYSGDTNHLIFKNCNHFCEDICCKLTGNQMPKWVHYATAYFQRLKATAVHQDHNFQSDNEKKRLRSAFSCLLSITVLQREVSMSSLFLHSHYKGCLPP